MVSLRRIGISNRVRRNTSQLVGQLVRRACREVTARMFAGEPVSVPVQLLRNGLLEGELPAGAICVGRDYVLAEEVAAKADARALPTL